MDRKTQNQVNKLKAFRKKALLEPEWFFEDFIKYPLIPWQYEMVNAALDVPRVAMGLAPRVNLKAKPRVTIRACHGPGKTQGVAALSHVWGFVFVNNQIAATAPKQDQLTRRFVLRYQSVFDNAPKEYQQTIKVKGRDITICGSRRWGVALETAVDPDSLAGYHDKPQLFIVDEASSRRLDPLFPVIEGSLTYPGSVIVEIGNPTRLEGEFAQHHNSPKLKDLYYRMHISYKDAPEFISPAWVETMRIKYGEDSPIFLIRALGDFASFDDAILVPLEFIEDSYDADHSPDGSMPKLRVSVDVHDGGADKTVITAARFYDTCARVLFQKGYRFKPSVAIQKTAEAAINVFEAFGGSKEADELIVDANGVGAGTAGQLILDGYNVIRHVGGEASDVPETWANRRTQNHLAMADWFTKGRISIDTTEIDDIEELERHILAVKRDNDDDDKRDSIQTADAVKKDLGESPDRSASFSMLWHGMLPDVDRSGSDLESLLVAQMSGALQDQGLLIAESSLGELFIDESF